MLIFFAGAEGEDFRKILKDAGAKNVLQSFWALRPDKPPKTENFDNYLLDSGGFSARQHGVQISVQEYANYLNMYKIKYAFNLDVLDLNTSLKNQDYLVKNTNTYIMPVYHGNEWLDPKTKDLLDYYIECFPYIALGGMAGKENSKANLPKFLNYVFKRTRDKTKVHGLGMTGVTYLRKYPFFSVDSTSWICINRYAQSKVYSHEMTRVRLNNRSWRENLIPEAKHWIGVQEEMTRLWDRRGIVWGNLDFDKMMEERKVMTYEEWKNERL